MHLQTLPSEGWQHTLHLAQKRFALQILLYDILWP